MVADRVRKASACQNIRSRQHVLRLDAPPLSRVHKLAGIVALLSLRVYLTLREHQMPDIQCAGIIYQRKAGIDNRVAEVSTRITR